MCSSVTLYDDELCRQEDDSVAVEKRQLRGDRRKAIASVLVSTEQPATEVYNTLSTMADDECLAGNATTCQTPGVLRQAVCEQRKQQQLHEDVVRDVRLLKQFLDVDRPARHCCAFIQEISLVPFKVVLYTQQQAEAYVAECKGTDGGVMHVDCTGSIVPKSTSESDKPLYLCSCILSTNSLPAVEFITNRHSATWICSTLMNFGYDVRRCNCGQDIFPSHVVTDFSYALMYAIIRAFNCMTLSTYLQAAYKALTRPNTRRTIPTCLAICCAHMIKAVSRRLAKVESNAEKRKAGLVMFTALQNCAHLHTAGELYGRISVLLKCQTSLCICAPASCRQTVYQQSSLSRTDIPAPGYVRR